MPGPLPKAVRGSDAAYLRSIITCQVSHVGPDLQFATAEVAKSTAEGSPAPAAAAG